ncbi:hypothetical protein QQS21_000421 [Conoideocrella luteorostrata]|uniref:C6 zinc finger domain protein n=1 Tax=Conoideocrella luteorostrata TaxID=1105319 RepID=A0AAJ0G406_9HYPO|nr:hypothetical protein QQS21_000421 [Conoideocrella luteorostrata]
MPRVKPGQRQRARAPKTLGSYSRDVAILTGTSTGRSCDGYEPIPVNASPKFITVVPVQLRREESRSMQFFCEKTLLQLTSFFKDEFWTRQVLQVADSENCIRHSLIALASYHELYMGHTSLPTRKLNHFALRHYNLSIGAILGSKKTPSNTHTHLISCVMFICIEALQKRTQSVLQLVKAGYRMLREYGFHHCSRKTDPNWPPAKVSDANSTIRYTYNFLRRIVTQLYLVMRDLDPELSSIVSDIMQSHEQSGSSKFAFESLSDAQQEISHMRLQLEQKQKSNLPRNMNAWFVAFKDFQANNEKRHDANSDRRAVALLELQARFLAVDIAINCTGEQVNHLLWDEYTKEFDKMLNFAEEAMELRLSRGAAGPTPQFHMHSGTVPVLYGIIARCRDPAIRRRAVTMMLSQPLREGILDSNVILGLGRKIMAAEEGSARTPLLVSCSDIPVESRVQKVSVAAGTRDNEYMVGYQLGRGWWWESVECILNYREPVKSFDCN